MPCRFSMRPPRRPTSKSAGSFYLWVPADLLWRTREFLSVRHPVIVVVPDSEDRAIEEEDRHDRVEAAG